MTWPHSKIPITTEEFESLPNKEKLAIQIAAFGLILFMFMNICCLCSRCCRRRGVIDIDASSSSADELAPITITAAIPDSPKKSTYYQAISTDDDMESQVTSKSSLQSIKSVNSSSFTNNKKKSPSSNNNTPTKPTMSRLRIAKNILVSSSEEEYLHRIDDYLRNRDDFYSPGYSYNIDKLREAIPPPKELKIGAGHLDYVSFLRSHPTIFEINPSRTNLSLLYLTPYRGNDIVRGYFHCVAKYCKQQWVSDHSGCDKWETCLKCKAKVYPYKQTPLPAVIANLQQQQQQQESGQGSGSATKASGK